MAIMASQEKFIDRNTLLTAARKAYEFIETHNPDQDLPQTGRHGTKSLDDHLTFIIKTLLDKNQWPKANAEVFPPVAQSSLISTLVALAKSVSKGVMPTDINPYNYNIANHALVRMLSIETEYNESLHAQTRHLPNSGDSGMATRR